VTRYEHTQIGHAIIWTLGGLAVVVGIIAAFAPSVEEAIPLIFEVGALLLIILVLFYKLTVKIDNETLRACFGVGLICKTVLLAEIAGCKPIRGCCGWGIHLCPTPYGWGWLYNVSGWDAVAIRLRDGARFALGTDDPEGLVDAIENSIAK